MFNELVELHSVLTKGFIGAMLGLYYRSKDCMYFKRAYREYGEKEKDYARGVYNVCLKIVRLYESKYRD